MNLSASQWMVSLSNYSLPPFLTSYLRAPLHSSEVHWPTATRPFVSCRSNRFYASSAVYRLWQLWLSQWGWFCPVFLPRVAHLMLYQTVANPTRRSPHPELSFNVQIDAHRLSERGLRGPRNRDLITPMIGSLRPLTPTRRFGTVRRVPFVARRAMRTVVPVFLTMITNHLISQILIIKVKSTLPESIVPWSFDVFVFGFVFLFQLVIRINSRSSMVWGKSDRVTSDFSTALFSSSGCRQMTGESPPPSQDCTTCDAWQIFAVINHSGFTFRSRGFIRQKPKVLPNHVVYLNLDTEFGIIRSQKHTITISVQDYIAQDCASLQNFSIEFCKLNKI